MTSISPTRLPLILNWPPSILRPNDRSHWRTKNPVKVKYKEDCYYIANQTPMTFPDGNIPLAIVFYPPNNRGDLDGMLSAIKSGLDAIANAWHINDKRFRPITLDVAPADKNRPRVEITL